MSDTAPPQAGWYADPENPAGERWWNGSGWSDHKRAATPAPAPQAVPAPSPVVAPGVPVPPADGSGFTFGVGSMPADAQGRPDPYAAPQYPGYSAPPYGSPYVAAPYGSPAAGASNGLALGGFITSLVGAVLGILIGPLPAIVGIVLSAFGLAQAKKRAAAGNPNTGRSLAMAGLIIGIAVVAITLVVVIVYVVFLTTTGYSY